MCELREPLMVPCAPNAAEHVSLGRHAHLAAAARMPRTGEAVRLAINMRQLTWRSARAVQVHSTNLGLGQQLRARHVELFWAVALLALDEARVTRRLAAMSV